MEYGGLKKHLTEQVKQDVFIDMVKRKSKYMLENLGRIQVDLRLKTELFDKNKQPNIINFSSNVRQMLQAYEIMVNEIKVDLEMSDLKMLGLAIQKLFTHMLNIAASLMKGCLQFHKGSAFRSTDPNNPMCDKNSDSVNHKISEYEGKMDEIRMREHMRFMFNQQDQKGQERKFQENQQLWNLINKNIKDNVIKCTQLQSNQVDKKLVEAHQNICKNEADITKILQMLEYNLSFRYDDVSIPRLVEMQSQYASFTTEIVAKVQTIFRQLKFKKQNMKQISLQTLPDHQLQFFKAQLKCEKNKYKKLYQQNAKEKTQRVKQIQKLADQLNMFQEKQTKLTIQNKMLKEKLASEQQMNNQLKKIIKLRSNLRQPKLSKDHSDIQSVSGLTSRSKIKRQESRNFQIGEIGKQQNQKQQLENKQKQQKTKDAEQAQVNHVKQSVLAKVGVRKSKRVYTMNKFKSSSAGKSNFYRAQEESSPRKKQSKNDRHSVNTQLLNQKQKFEFNEIRNSAKQKTVMQNERLTKIGQQDSKNDQENKQVQIGHKTQFSQINQENEDECATQLDFLNLVKNPKSCCVRLVKKQSNISGQMVIISQQATPNSITKKLIEQYVQTQLTIIPEKQEQQKGKRLSFVNNLFNMTVSSQIQSDYCMKSRFSKSKLRSEDKQNKANKHHSLFFNRPLTITKEQKQHQICYKVGQVNRNTFNSTFQTFDFSKKQTKIRQLNKMVFYRK